MILSRCTYAGFYADEDFVRSSGVNFSNRLDVLRWFKEEFKGWGSIWDESIQTADLPFVPRQLYFMPLDQPWEALPNLTLLGDAAHVMPPYAGEGVNVAMLDALDPARCLMAKRFPETRTAIAAYETTMRARASVAVQESLQNTAALHSPGAATSIVAMFKSHGGG